MNDELEPESYVPIARHFKRSESLASFAGALAKAQGQMKAALKDQANPFFKSKYADLASVRDACQEPLSSNGLAVLQFPRTADDGIEVETLLIHESGEWVSEVLALPVAKSDAQGVGSAITYARRYALSSIVGVAPEEDDGNAASKSLQNGEPAKQQKQAPKAKQPSFYDQAVAALAKVGIKEDQFKMVLKDKGLSAYREDRDRHIVEAMIEEAREAASFNQDNIHAGEPI